jgi:hypothetical protein
MARNDQAEVETPVNAVVKAAPVIYADVDEARENKPDGRPRWKLWSITHKGATRFVHAAGLDHALRLISQGDGYVARCLDRKPVNPVMLTGMLAAMGEAERNAILAQFGFAAGGGRKAK